MKGMEIVTIVIAITAMAGTVLGAILTWKALRAERKARENLSAAITKRKPNVKSLTPIIEAAADSWKETVPIANVSESELAYAHNVHALVTFSKDNLIKRVDAGPLKICSGGEGEYFVEVHATFLPPLYAILYPSVIVEKSETPVVQVSFGERAAHESMVVGTSEVA